MAGIQLHNFSHKVSFPQGKEVLTWYMKRVGQQIRAPPPEYL